MNKIKFQDTTPTLYASVLPQLNLTGHTVVNQEITHARRALHIRFRGTYEFTPLFRVVILISDTVGSKQGCIFIRFVTLKAYILPDVAE